MVLGLIPCSSAIWETGKFSSLILLRIYSLISGEILNDFFICSYCRNTWRKCQRFGVPAIFSSEESANKHINLLADSFNAKNMNTENMKPLQISWSNLVDANKYGLCHALIIQDDGNPIILPLIKEI